MKQIFFLLTVSVFAFAQSDSVAVQLADAERSFSALSEKEGIKHSFVTYLSDDCVMFNPYPVNGKKLYQNRPASAAFLTWFPTFVEASSSGDFGISTGPWEYRNTKNDTSAAYGHFFSVWKKQSEGSWKVTLDLGIDYPKEKKLTEKEHVKTLRSPDQKQPKRESARVELLDAENNFIRSVEKVGTVKAYSQVAAGNMRVYRNGSFPTQTNRASLELIKDQPHQTKFSPKETQVASSGDLGFTYGFAIDAKNDSSSYVRVWRKEKEWKIAVDILQKFKP